MKPCHLQFNYIHTTVTPFQESGFVFRLIEVYTVVYFRVLVLQSSMLRTWLEDVTALIQFQQLHPFSSARAKLYPKWCWGRCPGLSLNPKDQKHSSCIHLFVPVKAPQKKGRWRFWTTCQNQIQITLFWISTAGLSFPIREE